MAYQIQHQFQHCPTDEIEAGTYYYQVKTITGTIADGTEKMSAFTDTKLKVVDQMPTMPGENVTATPP